MRDHKQKREQTRQRMLEAAGRGFRLGGYGGVGVDGLAKEAGLTSGAFYSHFTSKARAFRQVLVEGLALLRRSIERIQIEHGDSWQREFAKVYFRDRLEVGLEHACALPTLSGDAARADDETRRAYETQLAAIVETLTAKLPDEDRSAARARAWVLLALCSGGASMARAVEDEELAREIARAVEAAARDLK